MFLRAKNTPSTNHPLPRIPPQTDHKNTTLCHQVFPKPPSKTATSPPLKKTDKTGSRNRVAGVIPPLDREG
jgi:hypothetical protein